VKRVALLPGDGIGPEIVTQAWRVVCAVTSLSAETYAVGGHGIDVAGAPLPDATLAACEAADAVFLGAVGGPRWAQAEERPEQGLLQLRKRLGLYANLRPVRVMAGMAEHSPLRPERVEGVDLLFVRELTGGIYFGEPREEGRQRALDTMVYTEPEVRRIAELGFRLAAGRRGKVTSVDKANVLASSRLWRRVVDDVARAHPEVAHEHRLVDACAMRLISEPGTFDVVLAGNLFGDVLSDEAGVIVGSLGLLPSASTGDGTRGLYEPIHGSAPDIAGLGIANPIGAILSAAMMLRHSLDLEAPARRIEEAVSRALGAGARTADLGGTLTTAEMADAVLRHIDEGDA